MFRLGARGTNSSFRFTNREVVGIDLSGNSLKLVYAKSSHLKVEIVNLIHKSIEGLADDEVSKIIRSFFIEEKLKTANIINIIPSSLIITKNIEIPSRNPQEIKEIINLQAGRHTPYSREEVIVDYIDTGTYKDNYTKILLAIAARETVRKQCNIFERAGLRLEKVLFASEGVGRFVSRILKLEAEDLPTSIVHIDEDFTDFIIVFHEKAIYIRNIPIGTRHLAEEKEHQQLRLIDEIRKSLEAYSLEDIEKKPRSIVLTGASEAVKDLEPILANTLHIPIKVLNYLEYIPVAQEVLETTSSDFSRMSFLNIIAPVFILGDAEFDLTPEEIKLRRAFEERSKDLIKTAILIFTTFTLICITLASRIYFKSTYLDKLNKEYQVLDQEAQRLEEDFIKVKLARKYLSNRGYSLEVLTELYEVAPLNLQFNDFRFDMRGSLSIRGTADTIATVFAFADNIKKSEHFRDVETKYTTKRKEGLSDVTDFEITCLFNKKKN